MNDAEICAFVEAIYDEIIPVLDLPRDELVSFASAVTRALRNPLLLSLSSCSRLRSNGMTKYAPVFCRSCWRGRKRSAAAARLTFATALIAAPGERDGESYQYRMTPWISRYQALWARHRDGQMSAS